MSKIVDISEAKTQLDELVTLAIQGTEVIIVQDEQPLVRLGPAVTSQRSRVAQYFSVNLSTPFGFASSLRRETSCKDWTHQSPTEGNPPAALAPQPLSCKGRYEFFPHSLVGKGG